MAKPTRWLSETKEGHSQWYIERFRKLAADGADLTGEARLADAMLPRGARVLDAGCGTGRIAGALHDRGHAVVGVDVDPALIEAARTDHPGPRYLVGDLSELDLGETFDGAVLAGNVIVFVAPGTETEVLRRVGAHVVPDGFVVAGFHVNRHLALADFDAAVHEAGLRVEHRFATWDLRAWQDDADFAVSVLRHG